MIATTELVYYAIVLLLAGLNGPDRNWKFMNITEDPK